MFSESVAFAAVLIILKLNLNIGIDDISIVGFLSSNVIRFFTFFPIRSKIRIKAKMAKF